MVRWCQVQSRKCAWPLTHSCRRTHIATYAKRPNRRILRSWLIARRGVEEAVTKTLKAIRFITASARCRRRPSVRPSTQVSIQPRRMQRMPQRAVTQLQRRTLEYRALLRGTLACIRGGRPPSSSDPAKPLQEPRPHTRSSASMPKLLPARRAPDM